MKHLQRALHYFRPDAPRLFFVFLLMLAGIGLNLLKPWPLALIVDSVLGSKALPKWMGDWGDGPAGSGYLVSLLSLALLGIYIGQGVLSALQNFLAIKIGLRGLTRVRNEVFEKLQQLSMRFHQKASSGDLIYRASWDTYAFQTLFQQGLITFVTSLLSLVLMVTVMVQINLHLTVAALSLVPLLIVTIRFFGRKMSERTSSAQQSDSKVTSLVQQAIAAMPLIQSYTREHQERTVFSKSVGEAETKRVSQHGSELLYWFGIAAVFGIGTAGLTWLGAIQVLGGELTVGQLLVFLGYLTLLYEPLNQLSHVGATVSGANAGVRRVFELLDSDDSIQEAPKAQAVEKRSQGRLEFRDVSFAYKPGQDILRGITVSIQPGETVAIVGPSGVGKTTLLNLIPRFFDPEQGSVTLDGVDLRDLKVADLRKEVALVLQQPIILPGTIAENIGYGKVGATQGEIESAARAANAHQFIEKLPDKYQTVVGEGAARLSVGEQQRINLARAFLKDAPVLLLDEPTSALDADTEALVVSSLQKLMRNRTTLIVAHRYLTIRRVDRIIVLEQGRVVDSGSHDQLLARNGYYARLVAGHIGGGA